jgi:Domain of unknown function (DUF5664)
MSASMEQVEEMARQFNQPCTREAEHDGPCNGLPRQSCPGFISWEQAARQAAAETRPGNKASNPKDAVGVRKARWFSYIPLQALYGVGLAFLEGARKYGKHNYRKAGVRASVYVDAAVCGHLTPWFEGEDIDPASGLSHIDKAIASLLVLRDSMMMGNWVDDRPIRGKLDMDKLHQEACAIIDRIPDPVKPYLQIDEMNPQGADDEQT